MTVYKMIEVVGTSNTSFSDAVRGAIQRASQTIEDIRWFEVKEMRGRVEGAEIAEFQVKLDIAFHLHESGKATGAIARRSGPTKEARSQAAQAAAAKARRRR